MYTHMRGRIILPIFIIQTSFIDRTRYMRPNFLTFSRIGKKFFDLGGNGYSVVSRTCDCCWFNSFLRVVISNKYLLGGEEIV